MKKKCGSCVEFLKFKNKDYSLCNLHDCRCYTDSKICQYYKAIPYSRNKISFKEITEQ